MTNEDDAPFGRTMLAAHRANVEGRKVVIKPGEFIEAKFARGASPSLSARKVLALLIAKAGGDAWQPGSHTITKKELRGSHDSNDRINAVLDELMDVKFKMRTISSRGRDAVLTAALMDWNIEEVSEDNMSVIEWSFTDAARQMLQGSDYYARINRAALLAFQSKYALAIYELGCLMIGRRDKSWHGSVQDVREKLGVPEGSLTNFAEMRRSVLTKAQAEVNQIAHFTFEWKEIRSNGRGRPVEAVQFLFALKGGTKVDEAASELDRPRAGRKARRDGTAENVIALPTGVSFPASGAIDYADRELVDIAREHGGGWDKNVIADAYRQSMGSKLSNLSGDRLLKSWQGFIEAFVRTRGRV